MSTQSPIDAAFHEFTESIKGTRGIRQKLITDLSNKIDIVKMDPTNEQPRTIEVKVQLINTLASLLKDEESIMERNVKLNLSRKESEDNSHVSASIGALLKAINLNGNNTTGTVVVDKQAATEALNARGSEHGVIISDGELIECSGGPTTSAPVDTKKIEQKPSE